MSPMSTDGTVPQSRRTIRQILKSYFFWTYSRGCFHYDVMVSLILLFIFVSPHLWNFGDSPKLNAGPAHPIQVVGNGTLGLVVTVQASDVDVPAGANDLMVKKALREAIMPVTGDAVFVEHWETFTDNQGNVCWKVWAHR
jgi:hypothetical protein